MQSAKFHNSVNLSCGWSCRHKSIIVNCAFVHKMEPFIFIGSDWCPASPFCLKNFKNDISDIDISKIGYHARRLMSTCKEFSKIWINSNPRIMVALAMRKSEPAELSLTKDSRKFLFFSQKFSRCFLCVHFSLLLHSLIALTSESLNDSHAFSLFIILLTFSCTWYGCICIDVNESVFLSTNNKVCSFGT
jgi:hypothetical protein